MSVLIVGSEGSMGNRYQAILRHLNKPFTTADLHTPTAELKHLCDRADGIIIATPTDVHFDMIVPMAGLGVPLLCEKPLSKNRQQLNFIRTLVEKHKLNLTMMAQYRMLDEPGSNGETFYSYFRHGNDGLYWDCIQPIGLARSVVLVEGSSPIWKCRLNGKNLNLGDMDQAYVDSVSKWLRSPGEDIGRTIEMHEKVIDFICSQPSMLA